MEDIFNVLYKVASWFANCPYFTFISGLASIGSAGFLIKLFYKFKKHNKSIANTPNSTKIIDYLIKETNKKTDVWTIADMINPEEYPELYGKIVPNSSFIGTFGKSDKEIIVHLVKTSKSISLYIAIGLGHSRFRLITTSNNHPMLIHLYNEVTKINELSDEDYMKEIIERVSF